jgi:transcription initiation factor TFIID subunit 6
VEDVNLALRLRNVDPLFGYTTADLPGIKHEEQIFKRVQGADMFVQADRAVHLEDIIKTPLPKVPADVTYTAHWLAVEGVQPAIPQNPPVTAAVNEAAAAAGVKPSVVAAASQGANATLGSNPGVVVKEMVRHVLSRELQRYFQDVKEGVKGSSEEFRQQVLDGVRQDPGLYQLVPYFAQYVQDQVTSNLKNTTVLTNVLRFVEALVLNATLFLEHYLHQFMPAVITCVVGHKLGECAGDDRHWDLRVRAARLTGLICRKYTNKCNDIQARVTRTMVSAFLEPTKPLTTRYGAVVCLAALGPRVVELFLLDNAKEFQCLLGPSLENEHTRADAMRVKDALLEAISPLLTAAQPSSGGGVLPPENIQEQWQALQDFFGEALTPHMK